MAKRFYKPDWKQLRNLTDTLRQCYFYCWDKCDNAGVYEFDAIYLKADLGFNISFDQLLLLPHAKKIAPEKFIFLDFLNVNYGVLKEGYNPHKPAFRDLTKHNLQLNSTLNQAYIKLEEEDEEEDEEVFKDKRVQGEKEISVLEIGNTIEFLDRVKQVKLSVDEIVNFWKAFLINGSEKSYFSHEKQIQHFRNWLKNQNGITNNSGGNKSHRDKQSEANSRLVTKLKNIAGSG
jgi:hypothetical protein